MAENKKSALIYADLLKTVEHLPDDVAGRLFKTILLYINDENPVVEELLVKIAFEPVKQQMRRDLKKWEDTKEVKSQNGAIGNLKRWHLDLYKKYIDEKITLIEALEIANNRKRSQPDRLASQSIANIAVNVTDTVTVNDTVTDTVKKDVVVNKPSPSNFFTIHDFESIVSIGNNEFTMLACRKTKRPREELEELRAEFVKDQKGLTKLAWKDEPDAKNHFINWVKKQPIKQKSKFVM